MREFDPKGNIIRPADERSVVGDRISARVCGADLTEGQNEMGLPAAAAAYFLENNSWPADIRQLEEFAVREGLAMVYTHENDLDIFRRQLEFISESSGTLTIKETLFNLKSGEEVTTYQTVVDILKE